MSAFDLKLAQAVIPAEIGTEMQGTWANLIGKGAVTRVKELFTNYIAEHKLLKKIDKIRTTVGRKKETQTHIVLTNGWSIVFDDEPDVAIRDNKDVLRVAIEIKGSMDKAGAH